MEMWIDLLDPVSLILFNEIEIEGLYQYKDVIMSV